MSITLTGLEKFKNSVMALEARLDKRVTAKFKEVVTDILTELVANTPKWSGDMAASWVVLTGKNAQFAFHSGYTSLKKVPYEFPRPTPGDSLGYAMQTSADAIYRIRWNSYVSIRNNSPTLGAGDGKGPRPDFLIDPSFASLNHIKAKYGAEGMNLK